MQPASDLVRDSKLNTAVRDNITRHIIPTSQRDHNHRRINKEQRWERIGLLGEGAFGIVWKERLERGESDAKERAVKMIRKRIGQSNTVDYSRELEAIAKFSGRDYNAYFVQSYGWYESSDAIFIAMEFFEHGDLQQYLNKVSKMPEEEVQLVAYQILEGLNVMHENGFAHRDLKPANILIKRTNNYNNGWRVKIGDFGISKRVEDEITAFRTLSGTTGFLAPEILAQSGLLDAEFLKGKREYTNSIDIWSMGEIIYRLLCGDSPFTNGGLGAYVRGKEAFPKRVLKELAVSSGGIDLIEKLMKVMPNERLTAEHALQHRWFERFLEKQDTPRSSGEFISIGTTESAPLSHLFGAVSSSSPSLAVSEASAQWSTIDETTTGGLGNSSNVPTKQVVSKRKASSSYRISRPVSQRHAHDLSRSKPSERKQLEDGPQLPNPLQSRPILKQPIDVDVGSKGQDTPSYLEDEDSAWFPGLESREVVPLSDSNDHLDLHLATSLPSDKTTGKDHSQMPADYSIDMQALSLSPHSNTTLRQQHGNQSQQNLNNNTPDTLQKVQKSRRKLQEKPIEGDFTSSEKSTLLKSIATFNPFAKSSRTIGAPQSTRSELGPYAFEDQMPEWLHQRLITGPKITLVDHIRLDGRLIQKEQVENETPGIVPVLAQLSALDQSVKAAYYCHPLTLHIGKITRESGLFGYRTIQILISYIQGARAQGYKEFPGRIPSILQLQDLIEMAWDKGINAIGREQTGGIRNTRKYIGTPEAEALFRGSKIGCVAKRLEDTPDGRMKAHERLLSIVETYFSRVAANTDSSKVYKTLIAPLYLQYPGNSFVVVGFERYKDGSSSLVVLDPIYSTGPAMRGFLGRTGITSPQPEILKTYRRDTKWLKKHNVYEVLTLTGPTPLLPAWDVE